MLTASGKLTAAQVKMNNYLGTHTSVLDIVAIIVTYNPEITLLQKLLGMLVDIRKTIIVDNASKTSIKNSISQLKARTNNLHIISMARNEGIAKAQNIGASHALTLSPQQWH